MLRGTWMRILQLSELLAPPPRMSNHELRELMLAALFFQTSLHSLSALRGQLRSMFTLANLRLGHTPLTLAFLYCRLQTRAKMPGSLMASLL